MGWREGQFGDILRGIFVLSIATTVAVSPRALYDGRVTAWEQSHPVLSGILMTVFLGTCLLALLTDWLSYGLSALISYPAMAVLIFASLRWGRMRKGSPSGPDGEPLG